MPEKIGELARAQPNRINQSRPRIRVVVVGLVPCQAKLLIQRLVQRTHHAPHLRLTSCVSPPLCGWARKGVHKETKAKCFREIEGKPNYRQRSSKQQAGRQQLWACLETRNPQNVCFPSSQTCPDNKTASNQGCAKWAWNLIGVNSADIVYIGFIARPPARPPACVGTPSPSRLAPSCVARAANCSRVCRMRCTSAAG